MAEQQEIVDSEVNTGQKVEMEVEAAEKREREQTEEETEDGGEAKKQQVGEEEKSHGSDPVKLGSKEFVSSVAMFDYFTKFMHFWPTDLDVNKVWSCLSVTLYFLSLFFFNRKVSVF